MSDTNATLDAFRAELARAREKYPNPNATLAALVEEVGELARAVADESRERVRAEAIQVGAMALRMIEDGDGTLAEWRARKGLDALVEGEAWLPVHDAIELKRCPRCGEIVMEGEVTCPACGHEPADDTTWRRRKPDAWLVECRNAIGGWTGITNRGDRLWGDAESAREVEGRQHTHRRVPVYFGEPPAPGGGPIPLALLSGYGFDYGYGFGDGTMREWRAARGLDAPVEEKPAPARDSELSGLDEIGAAYGVGRACADCGVPWERHLIDGCPAKPAGEGDYCLGCPMHCGQCDTKDAPADLRERVAGLVAVAIYDTSPAEDALDVGRRAADRILNLPEIRRAMEGGE